VQTRKTNPLRTMRRNHPRNARAIPVGEAIELQPELIIVTARTFAPRTMAAAALATGATMAAAHHGHGQAPMQSQAPDAALLAGSLALMSLYVALRLTLARMVREVQQ